jgi:sec-independent protein translocase protein TatB
MFDVGFSELAMIGVVALVVLGPERLPKVARTAGHLFGRLQRYVNGVKADISREMEASEFAKLKQEVQDAAKSFEKTVNEQSNALEAEAKAIQIDAEKALADQSANKVIADAAPDVAATAAPTQAEILAAEDAVFAPPPPAIATSNPNTGAASQPFLPVEASGKPTFAQSAFDFGIEPTRASKRSAIANASESTPA